MKCSLKITLTIPTCMEYLNENLFMKITLFYVYIARIVL
jgi:hypothetical protein